MAFLNKKGYNAKLIDKKYDFGVYTLVFEYGESNKCTLEYFRSLITTNWGNYWLIMG